MDFWIFVGMFGIIVTAAQLIPQVFKSLKTKKVRDLSLGLGLHVGLSALTWLAYGFHMNDYPLMIANSINLICALILLVLKLREKKTPQ